MIEQVDKNINKDMGSLNTTTKKLNLMNLLKKTPNPRSGKYTFFSRAHRPFMKTDHEVIHK